MKPIIVLSFAFLIFSITVCGQDSDSSIVIWPKPTEETALALSDFQPKASNTDPSVQEYLQTINEILWQDLEYSTFFKMVSKSFYPAHRIAEPTDVVFQEWQQTDMRIDYLVIGNARIENNYLVVQCRVFDLKTKEQILGKQFRTIPRYARAIAHRISDKIVTLLSANASQGVASTQIVFERKTTSGKEINIMDYDGGNLQQLTSNGTINLTPVWLKDNTRVCFTSYQNQTPLLYYLSLENAELQPFPIRGGLLTTPSISPDGAEIAFAARLSDSSDTDIYISTLDGRNLRNITQHPGIDVSPCWSPTGHQLCFVSDRGGTPQIYISDSYGAGLIRITLERGYASSPDWSPDGRYIVFSWRPSRMSSFDLYLVEVATKELRQLTASAGNNENPSWSPDGRHIVFQSDRTGTTELFSMFADGSNTRQLTRLGGCSNPDWSYYSIAE
jgi:TolB protein